MWLAVWLPVDWPPDVSTPPYGVPSWKLIQTAQQWLRSAGRVAVLTGAGISAESGVPTFRGPGGLWKNQRPENLATPEAFERNPAMVQEWYDWRRGIVGAIEPNAGHRAIAALGAPVVTQNVDGLHQLAGSRRVLEVHGSIWLTRCVACGRESRDRAVKLVEPCAGCGGRLRPGVVWFGESLPQEVWNEAVGIVRECDLLLVVGTSSVVYPAAGLAGMARGAKVIEVNLEETPLSSAAHLSLRGKAGEILPLLVNQ